MYTFSHCNTSIMTQYQLCAILLARLGHTIRDRAIRHGRVVAITAVVVLGCGQQSLGITQERVQLAPPVGTVSTVGVTDSERDGALVEKEVDVLGSGAVGRAVSIGRIGARGRDRLGGIDNLNV